MEHPSVLVSPSPGHSVFLPEEDVLQQSREQTRLQTLCGQAASKQGRKRRLPRTPGFSSQVLQYQKLVHLLCGGKKAGGSGGKSGIPTELCLHKHKDRRNRAFPTIFRRGFVGQPLGMCF